MPKGKYASEEERQAARKEQKRLSQARARANKAAAKGRGVKPRRQFKTEEARKQAVIEREREKSAKKNAKQKADRAEKPNRWEPKFVGIDGESFVTGNLLPDGSPEQAYYLLLRSDKKPLFTGKPLTTWQCLHYLTHRIPKKTAFVGFFLNYDFEMILKDITQEEYEQLRDGQIVEPSEFAGFFRLQWFVGKRLVVYRLKDSALLKPLEERESKDYYMTTFQDTNGFFQTSFVGALKKWGFKDDERLKIITSGKAARGGFTLDNFDEVNEYNRMEMELLCELMQKVYESFKNGYQASGLKYSVHSGTWSGPGWFASDFLKQTNWNDEHLPPSASLCASFAEKNKGYFGNDAALPYPFSLSYFGGRIELAAVGKFPQKAFNYDITSAYPYAVSLLPKWTEDDFRLYEYIGNVQEEAAKIFLDRRLMGMYGVRFEFPENWSWYPFPVREVVGGAPTVFYPRQGETWVMSPELFAVLDTLTAEEKKYISITHALVIEGSDGYGDALNRMPRERLCTTAIKTLDMAEERINCKAASKRLGTDEEQEKDAFLAMAEKALKLILNSIYGKTVQQIGSHKYYNDLASAWITSVCRALLWRALAPERKTQNVLMTMTDGIYSLVKLPFPESKLTKELGDWESEEFRYFETFKPGIYRYESWDKDKKAWVMHYKVRGFLTPTDEDKENLFDIIWTSVSRGTKGHYPSKQFIPRTLAKKGWKNEPWLRQFKEELTLIESELRRKREPLDDTKWTIPFGETHSFFPPKLGYESNNYLNCSKGYALDFEGEKLKVQDEDDETRFLNYYDSVIGLDINDTALPPVSVIE